MKSSILRVNPKAKIEDITHAVPPFNVLCGAWRFARAVDARKEEDGVFVGVVDPGVGSERAAIVVRTKSGKLLVGPDNGLLSLAFAQDGVETAVAVENKKLTFEQESNCSVFHGRDLFAPVAGHLSKGVDIREFGTQLDGQALKKIDLEPEMYWSGLNGFVVDVDRFNLRTNIPGGLILNTANELKGRRAHLKLELRKGRLICRGPATASWCFAGAVDDTPLLVPGSTGYVDICIREKVAAEWFEIPNGWLGLDGERRPAITVSVSLDQRLEGTPWQKWH